jgi:hypothetical protein
MREWGFVDDLQPKQEVLGRWTYVVPEDVRLKNNAQYNEQWLQERIAENPKILGLGDVQVRDKERRQHVGGRLDLLLQEVENPRRYEVEIQLGATDESHVIRTIEYWDIERRRYPQYEHTAVIVAEDVTGRFLNVIRLFNGVIPLIAIKLQAVRIGDQIGLVFTKVLDELPLAVADEVEETREVVDRSYWEQRGSLATVRLADRIVELINTFAPGFELKYNKYYVGIAREGQALNFIVVRPKKTTLRIEIKIPQDEETTTRLEESSLTLVDYEPRYGAYRIDLKQDDIDAEQTLLIELMKRAYDARA